MTWFRVDDGFDTHPKVMSIPRGAARLRAIGLWTAVGTWCAGQLTDGLFEPHMIDEKSGTKADARWLLKVGLWHDLGVGCGTDECPEGVEGFHRFHDYLDFNPSRVKVLAERQAAAERQRRAREKARAGGHGVSNGVSRAEVRPSSRSPRPDPTPIAAAAATPPGGVTPLPPPLPPPLEILRSALRASRLDVRWDRLTPADITEIERLIEVHGDNALVKSALHQHRPDKPAAFAQAWLPGWRDLRAPGDLAVVAPGCDQPGHTGTTKHCKECASEHLERKASE